MLFYKTIQRHAETHPHEEVCGFIGTLLDNSGHLVAFECHNSHENPQEHFRIDLPEIRRAEAVIKPLATYHSHVNGIMASSVHDRAVADEIGLPSFIYVPAHKDAVCYVPESYLPEIEGRKFIPLIHDCLTFVRDYYRKVLNINLTNPPRTFNTWDDFAAKIPEWIAANDFEVFMAPEPHDILVFAINSDGVPSHAGVYEGDGIMCHQRADSPSNKVVYGGSWLKATNLVLRHKSRIR